MAFCLVEIDMKISDVSESAARLRIVEIHKGTDFPSLDAIKAHTERAKAMITSMTRLAVETSSVEMHDDWFSFTVILIGPRKEIAAVASGAGDCFISTPSQRTAVAKSMFEELDKLLN